MNQIARKFIPRVLHVRNTLLLDRVRVNHIIFSLIFAVMAKESLIPSASATQWNWIKVVPLLVLAGSFSLPAATRLVSERGVLTIYRRTNCRDAIISQREERTGVKEADRMIRRERGEEKEKSAEGGQRRRGRKEKMRGKIRAASPHGEVGNRNCCWWCSWCRSRCACRRVSPHHHALLSCPRIWRDSYVEDSQQ